MADYSLTAANIVFSDDATLLGGQVAGVAIDTGEIVYYDADDKKWMLAVATAADAAGEDNVGMAACSASADGHPLIVCTFDPSLTLSATWLAVNTFQVVSPANAGGIAPSSDLASNNYLTHLGTAISTTGHALRAVRYGRYAGLIGYHAKSNGKYE